MRKQKEIKQAIAVLLKKGDPISLIEAQTLVERLTERQVFQKYVAEKSNDERDESVFFAARDAARYAAGHLELQELMQGVECCPAEELQKEEVVQKTPVVSGEEMIQVSLKNFQDIMGTLKLLEKQVCALCGMSSDLSPATVANDLMELKDVLEYIGCGSTTLRRWVKKAVLSTPYRRGSCTYFSKQELDNNPAVQRYVSNNQLKEVIP